MVCLPVSISFSGSVALLTLFRAARLLLCGVLGLLVSSAMAAETTEPVYELRIYTCEPGKLPALLERFRDHTCKLFEKHGMKNVAYWVPTDAPGAETKLVYLLEHSSREAAAVSFQAFRNDPEWKAVRTASEEKHGKILALPVESTIMVKTDYSPDIQPLRDGKTYELRIYTASEGKLAELNARFRDHTCKLFEKHGMKNIGYWTPVSEPEASNRLIYVLEHDSKEAGINSFKAFGADPAWKAVVAETHKNGSLTAKKPESVMMKLTDFSARQK